VSFDVLTPLCSWLNDAWTTAEDGDYLRFYNSSLPDVRSVVTSGTTGVQPGYLIGRASSLGYIHVHDIFEFGNTNGSAPNGGAYAIGKKLVSPNYDDSEPFYIVLNNGLSTELFEQAVTAADALGEPGMLWGDLNADGLLGVEDLDLLAGAIQLGDYDAQFDIDRDNSITPGDYHYWVTEVKQTWIGDSDLNGEFDSGDLIGAFQSGLYEDDIDNNSTGTTGDWDGDRDFTTADMVAAFRDGGYELGPRATTALVPEPTSAVLLMIGFTTAAIARSRRETT